MDYKKFILKQIKSIAYASAGGIIVIGGASVDIVNAESWTVIYMIISAVIFNIIKEIFKNGRNSTDKT